MRKRPWLIIAVAVLVLLLTHPLYLASFSWGANALTVSEFNMEAESAYGQRFRVEGTVAPGSVVWDDDAHVLRFDLTDGEESLNIYYRGIVPENFRPGNDLTTEGSYRRDGVFEAVNLNSSRPICILCH